MKTLLLAVLMIGATAVHAKAKWEDDCDKALKQAKEQNKLVLLDFTGSDWCGWCVKLEEEVFSKREFEKFAEENLVLVVLDYPKGKKLSKSTREQNEKLKGEFKVTGYPTLVIVDAAGKEQARWGGYSKDFLEELQAKVVALKM